MLDHVGSLSLCFTSQIFMAPPQPPSGAVPQKDSKGGAFMTFMVMRFAELTLKDIEG
jgi:hypothetical protein